jgi:hypothetical protein
MNIEELFRKYIKKKKQIELNYGTKSDSSFSSDIQDNHSNIEEMIINSLVDNYDISIKHIVVKCEMDQKEKFIQKEKLILNALSIFMKVITK